LPPPAPQSPPDLPRATLTDDDPDMVPMAAGGAAAAVALLALLAALAVCRRRTRVRARRRAMMQSSHGQLRVWVNGPMAKRCVPSPLARPFT